MLSINRGRGGKVRGEGGPRKRNRNEVPQRLFYFPERDVRKIAEQVFALMQMEPLSIRNFSKGPRTSHFLKREGGRKRAEEKSVRRNTISEIALGYNGKCRRNSKTQWLGDYNISLQYS